MTEQHRLSPSVRNRIPRTHAALAVLVGDLVVLFAFVAVGQYTHGYFFWEFPARTAVVLSPFVVAWLSVAVPAGLFRKRTLTSYRLTVLSLVPAWVCASILSAGVRRTALIPGNAPLSFLLVNLVFGTLFVGTWRLLATTWLR
jgi:hypothetical protein